MLETLVEIGRTIAMILILALLLGIFITFSQKLPVIGRLPGDLYIRKLRFYFPLSSAILIILILLWLIKNFKQ